MTLPKIPLVDLAAQYRAHKDELDAAVSNCLARNSFIGGPDSKAFAEEFATWCGGGHAVPVGNGTDALELTISELLGKGDGESEIITVSHTFIGTTEPIETAGYRPVFVDIDPDTYLMDLDAVRAAIGPRTVAIIPVHLYGRMLDIKELMAIADQHGLKVIEDAAQAHGASFDGVRPGQISHAATFSFYPGKNLGAWGDGGAVFTTDEALAKRISMAANHGRIDKYLHEFAGRNSRLDGVQAAVLRVKLRHIDNWTERRRCVAGWYTELLSSFSNSIKLPAPHGKANPVYHLYVVEVQDRDRVLSVLHENNIGAGIHYPVPLHEQPAYRHLGYDALSLPATHVAAGRILSLPIFPEITREDVERVAACLIEATR